MSQEKISYEITFNKDIFAVQYLDHNGYIDPTATQGSCSEEPGQLMVPKGTKSTISEQTFIGLIECDGSSVRANDEFTGLPLCYSYSLKDICSVRKITTWTQVEDNWLDARSDGSNTPKDSIIGYKGSINAATQIDDYKTKIWNMKPGGVVHNRTYHQDRWNEMKETHTFNTEYGRWMEKELEVPCSAELDNEWAAESI